MITIETTRFSLVVTAFVYRYPTAIVLIDRKPHCDDVSHWCTNAILQAAIEFSLREGEEALLGFHDGPSNMWASDAALFLVQELATQHVLRYTIAQSRPQGVLARLLGRKPGA
jgi:hypothetical protein